MSAQAWLLEPGPAAPPKARARPRPRPIAPVLPLFAEQDYPHQLPLTLGDCTRLGYRYPAGKCEVWHCADSLIFNTATTADGQTLTVGVRGGTGEGVSLPARRSEAGRVRMEDLDAMTDAAVELHDALPSTCLWDYVDDASLAGPALVEDNPKIHMTLQQIGNVLGMERENVRRHLASAIEKRRAAMNVVPVVRVRRKADR